MWPYTIRLNPAGVMILFLLGVGLYLLYSASTPGAIRHFKDEPLAARRDFGEPDSLLAESINLRNLLIAGIKATEAGGAEVVRIRKDADGLHERSKGLTKEGKKEMVTKGDISSHWVMVHGLSATFTGLQIISEENHAAADEDTVAANKDIKPFHFGKEVLSHLSEDIKRLPVNLEAPLSEITVWIDPLDATQEYTENDPDLLKYVTTMMCVALSGKPLIGIVHAPFEGPKGKTYWGWAGQGVSESIKSIDRLAAKANRSGGVSTKKIIVSRSHSGGDIMEFLRTHLGEQIDVLPAGGAGYKTLQVIKGDVDAYVHTTLIKKWDICAPNALLDAYGGKMTTLEGHTISYASEESEKNEGGVLAAGTFGDHLDFAKKFKERL